MTRWSKGFHLLFVAAAVGTAACAPEEGAPSVQRSEGALAAGDRGDLDILFMIDNSSSMTPLQMKMLTQDPSFMTVLAGFPNGLPNIHVAVVSSDMGAPGDSPVGCSPAGDNGVFRSTPRGTCTNTTLTSGSTFISNVGTQKNYTGNLPDVFSCIAQLGSAGCGFEHQLAAVARALGADGAAPPAENAGFLRPNAELAIVLLTNEDDCSAPANTTLFSLNGGMQSITNPLGPIANYRCNQFGHLCKNPASTTPNALISPPLNAPTASGTNPPSLTLTECESNDTSTTMLSTVSSLIAGIRALKAHPDDQIVVGAISPPKVPYTVEWVPPSSPPPGTSGELWPQIQHSCGAAGGDDVNPMATQHTTDGSFGDPGVRIAQWVQGFGANGVVASICDADYGVAFQAIADKILAHLQPSTGTGAGGAGGAAASGTAGTSGGGAGAGGHAGSTGAAGQSGAAGGSGSAGSSGMTGVAGNGGTGTAGSSGAAGHIGGGGASGLAGSNGAAGQGASAGSNGTGSAGSSGTGVAGTNGGTGTGGNPAAGGAHGGTGVGGSPAGGGTGHTGGAGGITTTTGAGGASAGASGTGTGGQAGATGAGGTAGHAGGGGHVGTGGHAGATGGNGGASNASSDGCSCDTAASPAGGWNLTLLLGALGLVVSRRGRSQRRP